MLKIITLVQLVAFYLLLIFPSTRSFRVVQLNATFSYLGVILPLYLYALVNWKNNKSWYVISGILFAGLIAYVYNTQITISKWFNHHSLTHVLMTCYVIYMYFAVLQLHIKIIMPNPGNNNCPGRALKYKILNVDCGMS